MKRLMTVSLMVFSWGEGFLVGFDSLLDDVDEDTAEERDSVFDDGFVDSSLGGVFSAD